jgi:hypothetical protein
MGHQPEIVFAGGCLTGLVNAYSGSAPLSRAADRILVGTLGMSYGLLSGI